MKGLYYQLILYLNTADEKDTNYNIAWYMVHNFDKLATIGISDLAKACFVSPATISRFCRTIGYDNFAHLKQECVNIQEMKHLPARVTKIPADVMFYDPDEAASNYIQQINASFNEMIEQLDWEAIDRVLQYIHDGKKIVFFGSQFSHSAAMYLQTDLLMYGKFTTAYMEYKKQIESAKQLDEDSIAIIMSVNGNFVTTGQKLFHFIKKSRCKVIVITQNKDLNIEEVADEVILIGDKKYGHVGKHNLLTLVELMSARYNALYIQK